MKIRTLMVILAMPCLSACEVIEEHYYPEQSYYQTAPRVRVVRPEVYETHRHAHYHRGRHAYRGDDGSKEVIITQTPTEPAQVYNHPSENRVYSSRSSVTPPPVVVEHGDARPDNGPVASHGGAVVVGHR